MAGRTSQLPSSAGEVSAMTVASRTVELDREALPRQRDITGTRRTRVSRTVSALPREPMTVEKRTKSGTSLPTSVSTLAQVTCRGQSLAEQIGATPTHIGKRSVQLEDAVRAGSAGVHDALGDALV